MNQGFIEDAEIDHSHFLLRALSPQEVTRDTHKQQVGLFYTLCLRRSLLLWSFDHTRQHGVRDYIGLWSRCAALGPLATCSKA